MWTLWLFVQKTCFSFCHFCSNWLGSLKGSDLVLCVDVLFKAFLPVGLESGKWSWLLLLLLLLFIIYARALKHFTISGRACWHQSINQSINLSTCDIREPTEGSLQRYTCMKLAPGSWFEKAQAITTLFIKTDAKRSCSITSSILFTKLTILLSNLQNYRCQKLLFKSLWPNVVIEYPLYHPTFNSGSQRVNKYCGKERYTLSNVRLVTPNWRPCKVVRKKNKRRTRTQLV